MFVNFIYLFTMIVRIHNLFNAQKLQTFDQSNSFISKYRGFQNQRAKYLNIYYRYKFK